MEDLLQIPFVSEPALVWAAALWFGVAIGFLDRFEITLPRGDSIAVSGALVAAAILIVGPVPAAVVSMLSLVAANVGLGKPILTRRLAKTGASRVGAMTVSCGLVWAAGSPLATVPYYVLAVGVASMYLVSELVVTQALAAYGTDRRFRRLLIGNLSRQGPLLAAWVSVCILTDITYRGGMSQWSLLPVVALLVLMRQSYALLLEMRETYRTTVEVLVEAAEGQDARLRGHAERTAAAARAIAMRAGLRARDVERASYAALLHDIDAIAEPDVVGGAPRPTTGHSSEVFHEAEFFSDVLPVLRICDGVPGETDANEQNLIVAMIVALASDADVAATPVVAAAHEASAVARVAPLVPATTKARAVGAALELGYEIPAVR